ncbi:proton channel OTOP2 isoform X1, partial [Tachysurus ichikawai]
MHFGTLKLMDLHELSLYIHGLSFEAGMMSTKEELEHQESQISTIQHAGTHVALGTRSASIALSSTGSWRDSTRSWGWLLSGAVLVNVLVLGCALVSGSVFNAQHVTSVHLQLYLVALIVSTTAWMVFYKAYTCREDEAVLYKDLHAGPVWLR